MLHCRLKSKKGHLFSPIKIGRIHNQPPFFPIDLVPCQNVKNTLFKVLNFKYLGKNVGKKSEI